MNDPDWIAKNRRASYNMMPRVENWTAAYKLSQEEARDIAVTYVLNNYLTLEKPVTFGQDGAPTYSKIGERARLKLDNIGGVRFSFPTDKADVAGWTMTGAMDLRTAALAVRLAYICGGKQMGCLDDLWGGEWASAATRTTATVRALPSILMARDQLRQIRCRPTGANSRSRFPTARLPRRGR